MRSTLITIGMLALASSVSYLGRFSFDSWTRPNVTPLVLDPARIRTALAPSPALAAQGPNGRTWTVPFATSRQLPDGDEGKRAWAGRFTSMQLGICQVDVPWVRGDRAAASRESRPLPNNSSAASLSAAGLSAAGLSAAGLSAASSSAPLRETSFMAEAEYFPQVRRMAQAAADRDVLVFIHGYNVSFHDAVARAAELADQLPFNGVTICYSWPSQGELAGYLSDGKRAQASQMALAAFLDRLRKAVGPDVRIHLLAHSMGNRVLLAALEQLARPTSSLFGAASSRPADAAGGVLLDARDLCDACGAWAATPAEKPPLEHVIFAAPDVESETFRTTLGSVRRVMRHATLYASRFDLALTSSTRVNLGERRAGDALHPVLADSLVTIDVSAVPHHDPLGHSYYGNSPAVRREIFYRLKFARPPEACGWLQPRRTFGGAYWALVDEPPALFSLQSKPPMF